MTVLYVDVEPAMRRAVELWLARYGIHVLTASSLAEARVRLEGHRVDGVFLSLWLEDGGGLELYDWLLERDRALAARVAFVTGDAREGPAARERVARLGRPVLGKPFDLKALRDVAAEWVKGAGREHAAARAARVARMAGSGRRAPIAPSAGARALELDPSRGAGRAPERGTRL